MLKGSAEISPVVFEDFDGVKKKAKWRVLR